ncbi:MAG TPA: hypothetical protein VEJ36_06685 [Nitrososphaerales archaeon]|nr:hypothetical protein [Nitrososphaerales archaeon]
MPLKLPICNFDAKTGILCATCESKLKSGQISKADVEASKALAKLAERSAEVGRMSLVKAVDVAGDYVLELEAADVNAVRANPELAASLEAALKGKVWFVVARGSDRSFLEDLFYPARVLTVNTVWLPDGSKLTKVITPSRRAGHAADVERLKGVVKEMKGITLAVESEKELLLSS